MLGGKKLNTKSKSKHHSLINKRAETKGLKCPSIILILKTTFWQKRVRDENVKR